jgi:mannose-6-phosphate isomerase-like protein (cupin superfamily)
MVRCCWDNRAARRTITDLEEVRNAIVAKVYHITSDRKVALHKHNDKGEVFYCMRGAGFGVREAAEEELLPGKTFVVRAGSMHALRTDGDLFVSSFLTPAVDEQ